MNRLFFYGTLCIAEVFFQVTKRKLEDFCPIEAELFEYGAYYVEGESFPGLLKEAKASTVGIILEVDDEVLSKLWIYEGREDYELCSVNIVSQSKQIQAQCFFSRSLLSLSSKRWSLEQWKQSHDLDQYLRKVEKWCGSTLV